LQGTQGFEDGGGYLGEKDHGGNDIGEEARAGAKSTPPRQIPSTARDRCVPSCGRTMLLRGAIKLGSTSLRGPFARRQRARLLASTGGILQNSHHADGK
jgi:hypothetical protein